MNTVKNHIFSDMRAKCRLSRVAPVLIILLIPAMDVAGLSIGGRTGGFFNGTIDEVRIYGRGMSSEEAGQHYMSNLYKYDTNKWAFYTSQPDLAAGDYTYQAFAKDTAENTNETEQRTITVDLTQPEISDRTYGSCNAGSGSGYCGDAGLGGNITIKANVSDSVAVGQVWANITIPNNTRIIRQMQATGESITYETQLTGYNGEDLTWSRGGYQFTVWANDTAGNLANTDAERFNVSANVNITLETEKTTYTANEKVELETTSKIQNTGTTPINGMIIMQVYYANGSLNPEENELIATIINDTETSTIRVIGAGQTLQLDTVYNPNAWDTTTNQDGQYWIHARLIHSDGSHLRANSNRIGEDAGFIIDIENILSDCTVTPQTGNTTTTFNYTVNYTYGSCPDAIEVIIDGTPHTAQQADTTPCSLGRIYYYETTLDHRPHSFYCSTRQGTKYDYTPLELRKPNVLPTINLSHQLNLVSLPLQPENTSPVAVFASIEGKWRAVHLWDETTGGFKSYYASYPENSPKQELTSLDEDNSYWVYVTDSNGAEWTVEGTELEAGAIQLTASPCTSSECYLPVGFSVKRPLAMGDLMEGILRTDFVEIVYWDPQTQGFKTYTSLGTGSEFDTHAVGRGYYLLKAAEGMDDNELEFAT